MIDLKSNLDHLESLAADFHSDGHAQTATDFRTAIMDIQNLRDSKQLKKILSGYNGELRLTCGHVHRNIVTSFGDVICQIAPGVSHAVTMDLRTGAPNCLTKEPGGFLLHEIRGRIMSHHIPVGQYPGPFMFYPDK